MGSRVGGRETEMGAIPVLKRRMLKRQRMLSRKTKQKRLEHCDHATPLMRTESNTEDEQRPLCLSDPTEWSWSDGTPRSGKDMQRFPWRLKCPQHVRRKHVTKDLSTKPKEWLLQVRASSFRTRRQPHSHMAYWAGIELRACGLSWPYYWVSQSLAILWYSFHRHKLVWLLHSFLKKC